MDNFYLSWKSVTDGIYSGELTPEKVTTQLIELLIKKGIKLRQNSHALLGCSFFVYDKSEWKNKKEKPLGLGLVYKKPNGIKTQDIFFILPNGSIETYHKEKEMIKKYPWMKGVHKENLPL